MTGIGCFALVEGHHEFLVGFGAKLTEETVDKGSVG
jgi:hypothetical protein